jgi:hypothetical protein
MSEADDLHAIFALNKNPTRAYGGNLQHHPTTSPLVCGTPNIYIGRFTECLAGGTCQRECRATGGVYCVETRAYSSSSKRPRRGCIGTQNSICFKSERKSRETGTPTICKLLDPNRIESPSC